MKASGKPIIWKAAETPRSLEPTMAAAMMATAMMERHDCEVMEMQPMMQTVHYSREDTASWKQATSLGRGGSWQRNLP